MEKNKRLTNILLIIIVILVVLACVLSYVYFTKDKTKLIEETKEKLFTIENYPKVEASIATLPLAEAFKADFTGTKIEDIEIEYSKTLDAYENLINRDADLILVTEPSDDEKKLAIDKGTELEFVPIVKDAFVFFVNTDNPVDNLTIEQIQGIYSGNIKNWKDVEGKNEKIIAYQRPENSNSQLGMLSLVMKGKKMMNPISETVFQNMDEISNVISDYNNEKNSIGYSYYYYATKMYTTDNMKLISVDGIDPTYDNIQTGLYELQTQYYAVTRKDKEQNSKARELLDAMKSERGQNVAKEAGYVQNY